MKLNYSLTHSDHEEIDDYYKLVIEWSHGDADLETYQTRVFDRASKESFEYWIRFYKTCMDSSLEGETESCRNFVRRYFNDNDADPYEYFAEDEKYNCGFATVEDMHIYVNGVLKQLLTEKEIADKPIRYPIIGETVEVSRQYVGHYLPGCRYTPLMDHPYIHSHNLVSKEDLDKYAPNTMKKELDWNGVTEDVVDIYAKVEGKILHYVVDPGYSKGQCRCLAVIQVGDLTGDDGNPLWAYYTFSQGYTHDQFPNLINP